MEALLLNTLVGICIGRFLMVWAMMVFVPVIAVQVAYAIHMDNLDLWACIRQCVTLIVTADLAFLFGVLLRPGPGEV